MIGIGDVACQLAVYIGNVPPVEKYQQFETLVPAAKGDLAQLVHQTGNHWRKIINIYAKLGFLLNTAGYSSWQAYRDGFLLCEGSQQALLFDKQIVTDPKNCISLICGKTHAQELLDEKGLIDGGDFVDGGELVDRNKFVGKSALRWIDADFAIDEGRRLIVCPYFDYRQLSNAKLDTLVDIVQPML